jgi:maltooligosyltrehalose trehalohydrolase
MDDRSLGDPPVHRRHHMPFGAEIGAAGVVRFALWAPQAQRVELVLPEAPSPCRIAMQALAGGWFALETDAARAGTLYRFRIDGGREVPDPASRCNPQGVHGPSEVIDPAAYAWHDTDWRAPPWPRTVLYELHVGTFNAPGTYTAVIARLRHLARLGVTALELMPLAAFPGTRGWGYDGVLPFAPHAAYGRPEDLKALVDAAHAHGLAVVLDVVYNHFGPEGNYLSLYAPQFFNAAHHTPWGEAINFDGADSRTVRDFFIHNALYWLEEYHLDGLRLDAIHAVRDGSEPHIVTELAAAARAAAGPARSIYLTLENFDNAARFLGAPGAADRCDAQWNDDVHNCLHVLLTGETHGYYADYRDDPYALLCRALAEGFAYQGERSQHAGAARGERSAHLPPSAFINFLQNHDQVGNRARGERLVSLVRDAAALRAASAVLLLAPAPPLLFMGEEWAAAEPFPWFCDFEPQLAAAVRAAREREFPGSPDPCAAATCLAAQLDWRRRREEPQARVLLHYRRLLAIRRRDIAPLITQLAAGHSTHTPGSTALAVSWSARDFVLHLLVNLGAAPAPLPARAAGRVIFATHPGVRATLARGELAPWSVLWLLERRETHEPP